MVYVHAVFKTLPGKKQEFLDAFANIAAPLLPKWKAKLVGCWTPVTGESNEVIVMLAYENFAQRDKVEEMIAKDTETLRWNEAVDRFTNGYTKRFLLPASFSPLK